MERKVGVRTLKRLNPFFGNVDMSPSHFVTKGNYNLRASVRVNPLYNFQRIKQEGCTPSDVVSHSNSIQPKSILRTERKLKTAVKNRPQKYVRFVDIETEETSEQMIKQEQKKLREDNVLVYNIEDNINNDITEKTTLHVRNTRPKSANWRHHNTSAYQKYRDLQNKVSLYKEVTEDDASQNPSVHFLETASHNKDTGKWIEPTSSTVKMEGVNNIKPLDAPTTLMNGICNEYLEKVENQYRRITRQAVRLGAIKKELDDGIITPSNSPPLQKVDPFSNIKVKSEQPIVYSTVDSNTQPLKTTRSTIKKKLLPNCVQINTFMEQRNPSICVEQLNQSKSKVNNSMYKIKEEKENEYECTEPYAGLNNDEDVSERKKEFNQEKISPNTSQKFLKVKKVPMKMISEGISTRITRRMSKSLQDKEKDIEINSGKRFNNEILMPDRSIYDTNVNNKIHKKQEIKLENDLQTLNLKSNGTITPTRKSGRKLKKIKHNTINLTGNRKIKAQHFTHEKKYNASGTITLEATRPTSSKEEGYSLKNSGQMKIAHHSKKNTQNNVSPQIRTLESHISAGHLPETQKHSTVVTSNNICEFKIKEEPIDSEIVADEELQENGVSSETIKQEKSNYIALEDITESTCNILETNSSDIKKELFHEGDNVIPIKLERRENDWNQSVIDITMHKDDDDDDESKVPVNSMQTSCIYNETSSDVSCTEHDNLLKMLKQEIDEKKVEIKEERFPRHLSGLSHSQFIEYMKTQNKRYVNPASVSEIKERVLANRALLQKELQTVLEEEESVGIEEQKQINLLDDNDSYSCARCRIFKPKRFRNGCSRKNIEADSNLHFKNITEKNNMSILQKKELNTAHSGSSELRIAKLTKFQPSLKSMKNERMKSKINGDPYLCKLSEFNSENICPIIQNMEMNHVQNDFQTIDSYKTFKIKKELIEEEEKADEHLFPKSPKAAIKTEVSDNSCDTENGLFSTGSITMETETNEIHKQKKKKPRTKQLQLRGTKGDTNKVKKLFTKSKEHIKNDERILKEIREINRVPANSEEVSHTTCINEVNEEEVHASKKKNTYK